MDTEIENKITFTVNGEIPDPMLSISEDGFWVRGVKVEQGPMEAQEVYQAFLQWMTWASLTREH